MISAKWILLATSSLIVISVLPTAVALMTDSRTLNGVAVYVKPIKFQVSFAVHLLTVAWLIRCLPPSERDGATLAVLAAMLSAVAVLEIGYITYQASRGEASHFNLATPFTRLMYTLMGVGAVIALLVTGVFGAMILRQGANGDAYVLAAGLGLLLGSILGGLSGSYMAAQPGHSVGGDLSDASGLPVLGWSRSGGDLRVAHFVGLHMMQILPVSAWVFSLVGPPAATITAVYGIAAAGTLATGFLFLQAVAGRPLIGD